MKEKTTKKATKKKRSKKASEPKADIVESTEESSENKRGRGRPKGTYEVEFSKSDIDKIRNMAGIGLSLEKMAAILGVSKSTLEKRIREIPEISQAVASGRASAEHVVATIAYSMASSGKNYKMTQYWLNCRANWSTTTKLEVSNSNQIDPEQEFANKIANMTAEELAAFVEEKERKS